MAGPTQLVFADQGMDASHVSTIEYFSVWDFVLPTNFQYLPQTLKMEAV